MNSSLFSSKAIVVLVAGFIILFSLSVLLHAYDDTPEMKEGSAQTSSYSASAIGYLGFYEMLKRVDRPVTRNLGNPLAMIGSTGTLVLAEPDIRKIAADDIRKLISIPRLLLVLPKWTGRAPDPQNKTWLSRVEPASTNQARTTLALVLGSSDVVRKPWPQSWTVNRIGVEPSGGGTIQLMNGVGMQPIIATEEGILVGEIIQRNRKIWVVSDPDILSNHGLQKGSNTLLAIRIIDDLRGWKEESGPARIVFDETAHGFRELADTPIKLMFRFPFVVVTLLVCITVLFLMLSATARFGVPRSQPRDIDFGKRMLVGNGARLLDFAGHHDVILLRYLRMSMRIVAQQLHAPAGLNEPSLMAWLDKVGQSRGIQRSCTDIFYNAESSAAQKTNRLNHLFTAVREIYLWKGEMLNGSSERRHSGQ